jgi:hypothetical protein
MSKTLESLHRRRRRTLTVAAACLVTAVSASAQAPTTWLPNGTSYIQSNDLPPALSAVVQFMGSRMTGPTTALISITGTTTDASGSRTAQITVQAPGYLAYREGQTRAITFNGVQFGTKTGTLSASDEQIAESLLAHYPDSVFLQIAAGGVWRRIGSRFRTSADMSASYSGPFWTMWAFAPVKRPALSQGQALQQPLFIAIDEKTGLVSEVRVVTKTGPHTQNVVQTQLSNWVHPGVYWYPGQIVRLENGTQVLSFQVQQATVGAAVPAAAFEP